MPSQGADLLRLPGRGIDWAERNRRTSYGSIAWYANGKPYRRRAIERMTAAWGEAARVADCKPHRFRHTFASDLLRKGVDIRAIQKLLGHADIKSTLVYTKADPMLAAAILQALEAAGLRQAYAR